MYLLWWNDFTFDLVTGLESRLKFEALPGIDDGKGRSLLVKIVLHIGRHKTGSTAIQNFLFENRQVLLNRFGVLYPETGLIMGAHHLAAWSLQEPLTSPWALSIGFHEQAEELFPGIFQEAKTAGASTLLLSSEAFLSISSLDRLACLLRGHELCVIVYIVE